MERLTVKTSTIFVSVGEQTRVYRSMGEVPAGLRRKLEKSTTGMNAATILIADKRGREEIVRAVRGLPTGLQDRVPEIARAQASVRSRIYNWNALLEMVLPGAIGLLVWLAFTAR